MEKMKDCVQIGNFEIFLNERLGICVQDDCLIRRSLLELEKCITIKDAKSICLAEGLVGRNDLYGNFLYKLHEGAMNLINETVFTGDCHKGNIFEGNNCGSLFIHDTTKTRTFDLDLPVHFIRANWFLKNSIHPIS